MYQFHRTPTKTCFFQCVDCLSRAQRPVSIIENMSLNKHMFESRKADLAHQLETLETIMPHRNTSVFPQKLGPQEFAWYSQFQWITTILPMQMATIESS